MDSSARPVADDVTADTPEKASKMTATSVQMISWKKKTLLLLGVVGALAV